MENSESTRRAAAYDVATGSTNGNANDSDMQGEAILANAELYRGIIETSPDAFCVTDAVGNFEMVNQRALELLGYSSVDDITGKSVFEFLAPHERDRVRQGGETLTKGQIVRNREYAMLRSDGSSFVGDVSYRGVYDPSGKPIRFIGVVRDITDRKNAEIALKKSEERFRTLLDCVPNVGVLGYGPDGTIRYWNMACEKIYGFSSAEAMGRSIFDLIVPHEEHQQTLHALSVAMDTGDMRAPGEVSMLRKGGARVMVFSNHAVVKRSGRDCEFFRFDVDLSEQKMMEQEFFKAKKLESLGTLAGGVAHDFNNILTGIVTNLFMAKMSLNKEAEAYKMIIEAERSAFRAGKLTSQLLAFAKGGIPVKENVSIKGVIEDAVGFALSGSNVDYKLLIDTELLQVQVDRGQIDQVLNILIVNAKDAMPAGGTITVRAENAALKLGSAIPLEPGNYVRVAIEDEGCGISKKELEKIFDPYFTTKKHGSGLGLTVAYSIVKRHDGHLMVASEVNRGSVFTFYLPAVEKPKDEQAKIEEQIVRGTGRVLIMDDQADVRAVVEKLLRSAGYDVVCAADGAEAVEAFRKAVSAGAAFDVAILDLTVPGGMGAVKAMEKIKELHTHAKVFVSTGYSHDPILSTYKDHGFCGVVKKPFTIEAFTSVIKQAVELK